VRAAYGDARRTEITRDHLDLTHRGPDRAAGTWWLTLVARTGYAQEHIAHRVPDAAPSADAARPPPRFKDLRLDFVEKLVRRPYATTQWLCLFPNRGKVYWLKVYECCHRPDGRRARGKPMVNLLPLEEGEEYQRPVAGQASTTSSTSCSWPRAPHREEDAARGVSLRAAYQRHHRGRPARTTNQLVGVAITDGEREIMLLVSSRTARRSASTKTKCATWGARRPGLRGIRLGGRARNLIALIVWVGEGHVLSASAGGLRQSARRLEVVSVARPRDGQGRDRAGRPRDPSTASRWRRCRVMPGQESMLISSIRYAVCVPRWMRSSVQGRKHPGGTAHPTRGGERLVRHSSASESAWIPARRSRSPSLVRRAGAGRAGGQETLGLRVISISLAGAGHAARWKSSETGPRGADRLAWCGMSVMEVEPIASKGLLSQPLRKPSNCCASLLAVPSALQGCCSCRVAQPAKFAAIPMNIARADFHGRYPEYRCVVEEGAARGPAPDGQGQHRCR